MAKFKPAKGLDRKVARMAASAVDDVAREVERRARAGAPGTKTWHSHHDGRTRPSHVAADGQEIPENLRYELMTDAYDRGGENRGARNPAMRAANSPVGATYLMWDEGTHASQSAHYESNLRIAYANTAGCRCWTSLDPQGIAKKIRRDDADVDGTSVKARVWVRAPKVVQAELGEQYNLGTVAGLAVHEGTHFMENAARATARARSARRT